MLNDSPCWVSVEHLTDLDGHLSRHTELLGSKMQTTVALQLNPTLAPILILHVASGPRKAESLL